LYGYSKLSFKQELFAYYSRQILWLGKGVHMTRTLSMKPFTAVVAIFFSGLALWGAASLAIPQLVSALHHQGIVEAPAMLRPIVQIANFFTAKWVLLGIMMTLAIAILLRASLREATNDNRSVGQRALATLAWIILVGTACVLVYTAAITIMVTRM
jgi:hypothetical protein